MYPSRYPEYDFTLQSAVTGLVVRHMSPRFWNNCKYEYIKRAYFWSMCCFELISPRPFRDQWTFEIGPLSHHIPPKWQCCSVPWNESFKFQKLRTPPPPPGTRNIHFKMMISVKWLQIITLWKTWCFHHVHPLRNGYLVFVVMSSTFNKHLQKAKIVWQMKHGWIMTSMLLNEKVMSRLYF